MAHCALVAAGDFNRAHFLGAYGAGAFDAVVAVDGGYGFLKAAGVVPSVAIGDFDSLGYVPEDCEVRAYPAHKDKSDLEIALDYGMDQGYGDMTVYGALGGRLDHTLANLQLCARYAEDRVRMRLIGLDQCLSYVVGPDRLELPAMAAGTVSVFSLVPCSQGVMEKGLEYPLDNAELTDRTTWGLSNEFQGEPAEISLKEGTLIVFHPLQDPVMR